MINSCQDDTKFCLDTGRENNEDGENCNPKSPLYYHVKLYSMVLYGLPIFLSLCMLFIGFADSTDQCNTCLYRCDTCLYPGFRKKR
ncbi:hypothetical protein L2E82_22609 [Cichorium intybus]|uniref:Uncharacterized protein n=1 Tax=Cichorium intybus TaxID=13427 RepID=A0ACB9DYI3_CICIN|nr:hypothetical protein L2E82_22609 [Cichorium intybus]